VVILFAAFVDSPPRLWRLLTYSALFSATFLLGSFCLMNRVDHSISLSPENFELARNASIFGVMVGLILLGATARYAIWQSEGEADRARRKVDDLLENILPAGVVRKLKTNPEATASEFDEVTIMFADIVDFTPMAARLAPETLVEFLNRVFTMMDDIAGRHGLEKIKTIGDAYMVAAGIPEPRRDHAQAVAEMALELTEAMKAVAAPDGSPVLLRIGINTGPVAAGVIGLRKFAYDLWGNTVNTASRMESYGEPGRIQVTEDVYNRLRNDYAFEYRGEMTIKGKGAMQTWFLTGRGLS
jgi:class 3 adenylate cyclase